MVIINWLSQVKRWMASDLFIDRIGQSDEQALKQSPLTEISQINYRRLLLLMPYLLAITYIMFGLSLVIHEKTALQHALAFLAVSTTVSQILLVFWRPQANARLTWQQELVIDLYALSMLIWGAAMLGYDPNATIPYFDFLIAVFGVGIILLIPDVKLLIFYLATVIYLLSMTPMLDLSQTNKTLLIVSVLIFMGLAYALSRVYYLQFLKSLRLTRRLYEQQLNLSALVEDKSAQLIAVQTNLAREVIRVFAKVLDDYDPYTRGHSESVARLAERLARRLGYPEDFQQQLFWAGMIHDVGKIRIPKTILNKSTPLTPGEFETIRQHPVYGYEMIQESESLRPLAAIVLHHHEHYDGTGHPHGLRGEQIPIASQILALADAWDAMSSRRIYRDALSSEHATSELIRCSGKQFAPALVNTFILMIEEEDSL